jgi:hypothetical protein
VLQGLRDGLTRPQIVDRLRQQFEVDSLSDQLESDVGDFLRLLVQQALLSPEPGGEVAGERGAKTVEIGGGAS